ncbi:enoyl-CoA hydratase/isomerase family protein [Neoroseomonas terrae]|uniref:enoyl-CoA hydratase/isomerase family protein n=1 Tax=Neoroseomonas terrae TaxID=424799 RepID=UPI0030B9E5D5
MVADYVATVTLDRPPVNALSPQMQAEIIETFDRLSDRADVRAVVLTGAGRVFCAGADIKARAGRSFGEGERWSHNRSIREAFHAIAECRKPVVAAINGPALGGGLCFVASCDILVAAEGGSIGLPEIDVGLLGGGRHAMRLFGHSLTRRMMMLGYRVSGAELYRLGVVEACVPGAELMTVADDFARDLASKSPAALHLAKRGLNAIEEMSLRDGYRFEQDMTAELGNHPDSREAMAAFAERRPPRFMGS